MREPEIRTVGFRPAKPLDASNGLLGWTAFELGDLRVSNVAVRRTRTGAYSLSYPARIDRRGREHTLVQPATEHARKLIEAGVLAELARQGVLPS